MLAATNLAHDLFTMGVPVVEKLVRTALVYFGILALLRVAGKRDLAQLNSFDLVVLLLLSNVVQNAIIGNDNSLWGGVLGAAMLIGINAVVVRVVRRSPTLVRIAEGSPTVLVQDGKIDRHQLALLGLTEADVQNAVRRQNANTIEEVARATLTPGGAIVVELRDQDQNASKGDIARLEDKLDRLLASGSSR